LLYSRFAGMPQALWAALHEDGQEVIRPEGLQLRSRACGVIGSVLAVLGDPHRCVGVGVDMVRVEPAIRPEGTPLCWGGAGADRLVGVSAQVQVGEAWTRLSVGIGSGRCSRGGRW
jgi:hypothetical protein